jgi:hypothetical protein
MSTFTGCIRYIRLALSSSRAPKSTRAIIGLFARNRQDDRLARDQRPAIEALECFQAAIVAQFRNGLAEPGLQMGGMHRIQHRTDMIVGWDFRHTEQRMTIRRFAPSSSAR